MNDKRFLWVVDSMFRPFIGGISLHFLQADSAFNIFVVENQQLCEKKHF